MRFYCGNDLVWLADAGAPGSSNSRMLLPAVSGKQPGVSLFHLGLVVKIPSFACRLPNWVQQEDGVRHFPVRFHLVKFGRHRLELLEAPDADADAALAAMAERIGKRVRVFHRFLECPPAQR